MYDVTIINGNEQRLIHDHRSASNAQKLESGTIVSAENSISSFTFTIYPNNVGYNLINDYTTQIKVYNTKRARYDFVGRVLKSTQTMTENGMITKTVVCEDRMGFLHDSIQPYKDMQHYSGDGTRTGLEEFIDVLLNNHNAQVEQYKRVYRGTVTVKPFESSNDVTKGLNWQSTYDALREKLIDSFGGYLVLRETAGVMYLDYLTSVGTTHSTMIELGRNMRSASKEIDPSNIVTRLVPLGAKLIKNDEDGNQAETEERLTIASINNGLDYIESEAYAKQFGIKYGTVIFDDVTDKNNLLRKGTEWLNSNNGFSISHNVDALDLSLLGLDIDDFLLYDSYPVRNPLIGMNDVLKIIKKTTNVIEPQNSSFEMGTITKRLSDMIIDEMLNIGAISATNGKNSYLHLRYSASVDGSAMTEQPTETTKYIGIFSSMNREAPTNPAQYRWSLIRGSDGQNGKDGKDGAAGKDGASGIGIKKIDNYYLASNLSSGVTVSTSGWTTSVQVVSSAKKYLWNYEVITYTNDSTTSTPPCIIGNYAVDGSNGINGSNGIDGKDGVGISGIQEYYARSNSNSTAPTSWSTSVPTLTATYKYLWNYETITFTDNSTKETAKRVIGVYGDTGAAGKDAVTFYTWIKYADSPTSGMSDNPEGKKYMGLAYNKTTASESTTYSDYTWSLIRGEDGSDGINGVNGANGKDGKTYYTWVKYADNASGANMSNDPTGKYYIGIAYNKESSTESNVASDYTWSLFRGSDGVDGKDGKDGKDGEQGIQGPAGATGSNGKDGVGVERIVPRYAVGTSDTQAPSTPSVAGWSIAAPALSYGEYLWCSYYVMYTNGTSAFTEPFHARSADQIKQAENAPENPTVGTLWLDTTSAPYLLMRYNGTDWEVISDYSSDFAEVYTYVNDTVAEYGKTAEGLVARVEEETVSKSVYEEFSTIVKNILNMEADGTTMIFQTINEAILEVGNTEQSHYAELLTYIRFNDDGIEIGKQGNAITMKLDNDSLDFYNNGTRVAYMSDNTLYITDGRFTRSVRIGNYGFIPEANGSVSFTYLGGDS